VRPPAEARIAAALAVGGHLVSDANAPDGCNTIKCCWDLGIYVFADPFWRQFAGR
jgi:hypothetical protein